MFAPRRGAGKCLMGVRFYFIGPGMRREGGGLCDSSPFLSVWHEGWSDFYIASKLVYGDSRQLFYMG